MIYNPFVLPLYIEQLLITLGTLGTLNSPDFIEISGPTHQATVSGGGNLTKKR